MNTINLLSAISVLACNVSMANIPKQANSNDYGDIVVINRDIVYNKQVGSLRSSYGPPGQQKDYNVYRFIGSYSDERINFYSERYVFDASWNEDGEVIAFGLSTFFTLDIYDNTLLSSFSFKQIFNYNSDPTIVAHSIIKEYNKDLNITNLGNTLYFSNYNLTWKNGDLFPLVATCSDNYLPVLTTPHTWNAPISKVMVWPSYSKNYDNQHGSINSCLSEIVYLDDGSPSLNVGSLLPNTNGLSFTYKYYINNPTYEVIDLPNVMLSILTMPFTFFSQAFNLTLFPNTPYAINIGHTILIIVGVIGTIYLIRYLVSIFKG